MLELILRPPVHAGSAVTFKTGEGGDGDAPGGTLAGGGVEGTVVCALAPVEFDKLAASRIAVRSGAKRWKAAGRLNVAFTATASLSLRELGALHQRVRIRLQIKLM